VLVTKEARGGGVTLAAVVRSFRTFPRVLRLVWISHAPLTLSLAFLTLVLSLIPAATVTISQMTLTPCLFSIRTHTISPLFLPVGLQLE